MQYLLYIFLQAILYLYNTTSILLTHNLCCLTTQNNLFCDILGTEYIGFKSGIILFLKLTMKNATYTYGSDTDIFGFFFPEECFITHMNYYNLLVCNK